MRAASPTAFSSDASSGKARKVSIFSRAMRRRSASASGVSGATAGKSATSSMPCIASPAFVPRGKARMPSRGPSEGLGPNQATSSSDTVRLMLEKELTRHFGRTGEAGSKPSPASSVGDAVEIRSAGSERSDSISMRRTPGSPSSSASARSTSPRSGSSEPVSVMK